jgi:hypothetical protein
MIYKNLENLLKSSPLKLSSWLYGVAVSTSDSDTSEHSGDPGSIPGTTSSSFAPVVCVVVEFLAIGLWWTAIFATSFHVPSQFFLERNHPPNVEFNLAICT